MAKPRKPGTIRTTRAKAGAKLKSEASGSIEDAELVGEAPEKTDTATSPDETATDKALDDGQSTEADQPADVSGDDIAAGSKATGDEPSEDADATEAYIVTPDAEVVAPPAAEDATEDRAPDHSLPQPVAPISPSPPPRRGGFVSLMLGGVLAAALGAGALYVSNSQGWIDLGRDTSLQATVELQGTEIDSLQAAVQAAQAEVAALRGVDTGIGAANARIDEISDVVDGVSAATVTLGKRLEETNERLDTVATEPIPEARLPEAVSAAYETKFTALQTALEERNKVLQAERDARLAAIETRLDERLATVEVAQTAAVEAEQAALDAATATRQRAALADIDVALDTGTGFAPALETLAATSVEVPEVLTRVADGSAPTLTALQAGFPDAARAALVASTRAGAQDGSVDGLTAFFRTQLGARSLEPREGDDPDAVLSRAEAAVRNGDLDAALTEIAALPADGQAALADWRAQAETRLDAKAALAALSDQLNSN